MSADTPDPTPQLATADGQPQQIANAIPRDPTAYRQTDHFLDRLDEDSRFLTEQTVVEAIQNGEIRGTDDRTGWEFVKSFDGVELTILCGINEKLCPTLITAYPQVCDWSTAILSDRWEETELNQIELGTILSTHTHATDHLYGFTSKTPTSIAGHNVITNQEWGHVKCVDCGHRTNSKDELRTTECEAQ
jgi:hypothetical protein